MNPSIVDSIANKVKSKMAGIEPGHDFSHIQRVYNNAMAIHRHEGGNALVVALAALCHDLPDTKFFDPVEANKLITQWLQDASIDHDVIDSVLDITNHLGFSKELDGRNNASIEFSVVQDADRLEAIGALGIARAFSYGASKGRPFFDEEVYPVTHGHSKSYRNDTSPTVNHFFEKLFLLKDKMKTDTGRAMALERHRLMWTFLDGLFREHGFVKDSNRDKWLQLLENHKA